MDLTGEYTFVADAIDRHNEAARRCGALLVTMCGPQECCLYSLAAREAFAALRARKAGTEEEGKEGPALLEVLAIGKGGGMSGGTSPDSNRALCRICASHM